MGEREGPAVLIGGAPGAVQLQRAHAQPGLARPGSLGPAQVCLDAGHQHRRAEGLDQVVVAAGVQGADDGLVVAEAADEDHRAEGGLPQLGAQVDPVQTRELNIQQGQSQRRSRISESACSALWVMVT